MPNSWMQSPLEPLLQATQLQLMQAATPLQPSGESLALQIMQFWSIALEQVLTAKLMIFAGTLQRQTCIFSRNALSKRL